MSTLAERLAAELSLEPRQVEAAVRLLDSGATVPFVARYRKEATGSLSDVELRSLQERLRYLRELDERRAVILKIIGDQGKLTAELEADIRKAETKARLEDLYLPYRLKRRTKAQKAREAGLEALADALFRDPTLLPEAEAARYVDPEKELPDASAALEGARQILMERFAENADLLERLRDYLWQRGILRSRVVEGKEAEGTKFADYFKADEPIRQVPSHRALALFRGRREGVLRLALLVDEPAPLGEPPLALPAERMIAKHFEIKDQGRAADGWLLETVRLAWEQKVHPHLETELEGRLRELAEEEAIKVFGRNLNDLLLAAPAGPRPTMGLDPGYRTGVKVAVVDAAGKLVDTATIFPHEPRHHWEPSLHRLAELARKHRVELVGIGNGTASRETDRLVGEVIKQNPDLKLAKVLVSEAGASVYSASRIAAAEFPGLDVSLRGAVSIARRLQDPLAELVKIEPRSIGVGQYQHDVDQTRLGRALGAVVEDCVNAVGVDLNTASAPLLTRVSGLNQTLAKNIVVYREANGPFKSRRQLEAVPRMGRKSFEQAAGFLRIPGGEDPLDASAVHPEAYPVVERILKATGQDIRALMGNAALLKTLRASDFVDQRFGEPTVKDILLELEKPGRDPRPEFKAPSFKEGLERIDQLQAGMLLEGVVTNVTNFGAFVDIGVHQDGLVHVSALANRFVKDPRTVVKAGDIVKVKVLEVDVQRKRISLTMRLAEAKPKPAPATAAPPARKKQPRPPDKAKPKQKKPPRPAPPPPTTAMAAAFAKLKRAD
jgi:uncharacterized protein